MKTAVLALCATVLAASGGMAQATEYGVVLASTPVMGQLATPQQQCVDQPVVVQPPNSGGGAVLGALVGGIVGNSLGHGFGRAAATGLGVVAGAAIGDRTEAASTPPVASTVRQCQTVTTYQTQIVGYDVTYDYNGQRYSARLPQDPGPRIALDVVVAPVGANPVATAPMVNAPIVVSVPPQVVYDPVPVYGYGPTYAYPGIYGGVGVTIVPGAGYYGRRGHWR
jgi:uncharacterized protein YcfJ